MTTHPHAPTALKLGQVGELLASVAGVLGYTPTESLVVIGLVEGQRQGATVRMDLDKALAHPQDIGRYIGQMINLEHDSCVVLTLTDTAPTPGALGDQLTTQGATFCAELESAGLPVVSAWHVGDGYSRPMLDHHSPYPGEPINRDTPTARRLQPSQEATPQQTVATYTADHTEATPPQGTPITGLQLWDELADDSATLDNMAATEIGHLIAALAAHPTAIIVTATTDLLEGINALHCDDDKEHHRVTQAIGDAPNWDRITRLAAALKAITPYATATTSANIHAMMSWINYAKGRASLALAFAEQALHLAPGHHLASAIHNLATNGNVSPWAVYSWTAYQGT